MEERDIAELARVGPLTTAYDAAVIASPEIDRFCSASDWVVPAHAAFHADSPGFVRPLGDGFLALARGKTTGLGRFYAPLEAMWGLACPIIGADGPSLGMEAVQLLLAERARWDVLWLGGMVRDGPLFKALVQALGRRVELRLGPVTVRHQASLEGGFDGWLGRRSALFRKRTRQAVRGLDRAGLELEWIAEGLTDGARNDELFERIHAVEQRSWKGLEGTGFVQGDMKAFYQRMVPRLASAGRLRVLFAKQGGEDVAVCFGGVLGDTYRGLQNSFDERFRGLSLGNAMQARTIERLAGEGIRLYDLGSEMSYKTRWAEGGLKTITLIAIGR